jgi:hypothetical protein
MVERKTDRRRFLMGAAGLAGVGAATLLAGCAPSAPSPTAAPAAAPTTAPAAPAAAATAAPSAPKPAAPATLKYGDKICVQRYMTGGFTTPGADDAQVHQIEMDAVKQKYGLNIDIQYESATWADIDPLMELRLQTQAVDTLQRHHRSVLRWIATPGLVRENDQAVKDFGKNLLEQMPVAPWQFFMRDDNKYIAIPSLRIAIHDTDYLHVRRDWLQKVNREAPKTFEDFEEIMRLWKDKKLGGNVTIGVTAELGGGIWTTNTTPSSGRWHPMPDKYIENVEKGRLNDLEFTWSLERLEMAQRWVKDGLLNSEWGTWKTDEVYSAATKGMLGGIWGTWGMVNGKLKTVVMAADPSQDWIQVFPPIGRKSTPNTGMVIAAGPIERAIVVTAWSPCPEAIVALADWENSSWENFTLARRGIEGKHWKQEASGAITDLRNPQNPEYSGMYGTAWMPKWQLKNNSLPAPANNPFADPEITARTIKNMLTRQVLNVPEAGEYPAIGAPDRYCPYVFAKSQSKQGDMDSISNEYLAKIYNGQAPATQATVNEFYDKWLKAGGEIQVKEISDQFAPYIAKHPEWKDPKASYFPEVWNTTSKYPAPWKKPA